ncbi:hypothetical protein BDV95DRAFT_393080 [Massariosphaeria phaeospora]|uniref:Uncharacterized protein n=1 Tax=Massariosphaeria phaeospora TaxID=100035 RepID=A0A7C8IB27_9PLEO|nr:hypothetical protein BDV95DRAFT_393080 [Massariosphaeria phaeospora]
MHYRIEPPADWIVSSSEGESMNSIDLDLDDFDAAELTVNADLLKCVVCDTFWAVLDLNGLCQNCQSPFSEDCIIPNTAYYPAASESLLDITPWTGVDMSLDMHYDDLTTLDWNHPTSLDFSTEHPLEGRHSEAPFAWAHRCCSRIDLPEQHTGFDFYDPTTTPDDIVNLQTPAALPGSLEREPRVNPRPQRGSRRSGPLVPTSREAKQLRAVGACRVCVSCNVTRTGSICRACQSVPPTFDFASGLQSPDFEMPETTPAFLPLSGTGVNSHPPKLKTVCATPDYLQTDSDDVEERLLI